MVDLGDFPGCNPAEIKISGVEFPGLHRAGQYQKLTKRPEHARAFPILADTLAKSPSKKYRARSRCVTVRATR
jgi:hypothetical protein